MQYHIQPAATRLRYHQAPGLAHVPAHLHDSATGEWRRREGRAGTIASWLAPDHDGRIPHAVTPAKRNAQGKVVAMLREAKKEEKLG